MPTHAYIIHLPCASTMHIAGLILARGGSKSIPLKNLALLGGKPLLVWALEAMIRSQGFDSIWVSSDNSEILQVALQHGARIHRRSAETSSDQASSIESIQEFLLAVEQQQQQQCHSAVGIDAVGLVQCTSPFVTVHHLEMAIEKMISGASSVFSVVRSHSLRWKEEEEEDQSSCSGGGGLSSADSRNRIIKAINFDPQHRPRRQDWRGELVENGAFYFTTVDLLKRGLIQGGNKISFVEMSAECSLDIDSPYDLWLAEQQVVSFMHQQQPTTSK